MESKPPAECVSLVVCAQVIPSDIDSVVTLRDTLLNFTVPGFPCDIPNLGVYCEVVGGSEAFQVDIRLRTQNHPDPIKKWMFTYSSLRREIFQFKLNSGPFILATTGLIFAEVKVANKRIGFRPVTIHREYADDQEPV